MRVWLRPDRMAQLGITVQEVAGAIQSQNQTFGIGQLGAQPAPPGVEQQFVVTAQGLLTKPEEFADIIVRTGKEGAAIVRIRDIGRVELAKRDYSMSSRMNGKTATTIGVYQQPGANAVATSKAVRKRMEELKAKFPTGLDYKIVLDTSEFTLYSIDKVVHTFFEAVILVVLVVFVFLQSLRATVIPILAVPVSIIGTFAGMHLLGFSINMLTMFGMILAIGLVVDDAIVVVENVEVNITQEGALAARCGEAGDDRDRRGADLHRAGAARGVPAGGVPGRGDGNAVQAVRHHHRDLDGDLGNHGAHPLARARRHHHQGPSRREESFLPRVRARIRARADELRRRCRANDPGLADRADPVRRGDRRHPVHVPHPAVELRARRGPGLLLRRLPGVRLGQPERHRAIHQRAGEDRSCRSCGAGRGHGQRLQLHRRPAEQQRRTHVRPAQALRRAQRPFAFVLRGVEAAERAVLRAQGGHGLRAEPAIDSRPGDHGRLRVLHPEPWLGRHARHRRSGPGVPGQGAPAPRAAGREHHLSRFEPAAVRGPRPQQGRGPGRAGAGRVPDHAGVVRLAGRRPVLPVQPGLVRDRSGGRAVPHQSR